MPTFKRNPSRADSAKAFLIVTEQRDKLRAELAAARERLVRVEAALVSEHRQAGSREGMYEAAMLALRSTPEEPKPKHPADCDCTYCENLE